MKVQEIVKIVEDFAPRSLAYDWDNTGLIYGNPEKNVKRLYITLDTNPKTVCEAVEKGCDMILSHHPILLGGIKVIDIMTDDGKVLEMLIKNDISLYASHTPTDCCKDGINDVLAEKLGIGDIEIIYKVTDNEGLGRVGNLKVPTTLSEFCETVKKELGTPFIRVCGDGNRVIKRVAVGGGACHDLIPQARSMGAEVMVTADMKYHESIEAVNSGVSVIDAGHYPTENFVIDIFSNLFRDTEIEIVKSTECDIFKLV